MIYLGSDHGGFHLKSVIIKLLQERGEAIEDMGTGNDTSADFPMYAEKVARAVVKHNGKGILFCKSGVGMCITANKVDGIRAATCWHPKIAEAAKKDNNINILCLPAEYINKDIAEAIIMTWLDTPFSSADRYLRRIKMITELEQKKFNPPESEKSSK